MPCRYRLLALDLDGTLLDARGVVSEQNTDAVRRAREAGLRVLVCTGRGYVEAEPAFRAIGQTDPVIVAGGAVTADPATGATLHRDAMDEQLVHEISGTILGEGHAALLLMDRAETGCDYLVVTGAGGLEPDPVTVWWFEKMGVSVRYVPSLDGEPHAGHTVRLGVLGEHGESNRVGAVIGERFGDRVSMQAFSTVVGPEVTGSGPRRIRINEAFDPACDKWPALLRVARGMEIEPAEIAAIGDEMNDLMMIRGAGLGVAMANARDAVLDAADRVTGHHTEAGVASAIDQILDGAW